MRIGQFGVSVAFIASICLALCALPVLNTVAQAGEIHPVIQAAAEQAGPEGTVSVIIHLTDRAPVAQLSLELKNHHATRAERHETIVRALRSAADRSQGPVLELLAEGQREGLVIGFTPYWISNLVVAQLRPAFLDRLAQRVDVDVVEPNFVAELIEPVAKGRWFHQTDDPADPAGAEAEKVILHGRDIGVTPGLRAINADRCWYELGLTGAGRLICGLDTGVDVTHPALETRWRGHGGAHPPEECWFDVLADSIGPPYDADEHGTHTMGTMCGLGEAEGDSIGVAWGAQWIASNAIGQPGWNEEFDNDVIACFQWISDPDGVPETVDDVPDVCQNSWGGREFANEDSWYHRCDDLWWEAIDNCEAAGVVVFFSAGNSGNPMSCGIPADRASTPWNTCAVGAIDATNYSFPWPIADFSSRGPSSCDEISIKPEVSAPGVDVISSVPGGEYSPMSGTSMAGPHVAGTVALMRQADPDLEVDRAKQILMDTSVDHGDEGEDNDFGWGVIDAYTACLAVMNGYGNLGGQVTDAESLLPVEGAQVSVPELWRRVLSDADGDFDLRHLPAGAYEVVTELFGYYPDTSAVVVEDGGQHSLQVALVSEPRADVSGIVSDGTTGIPGVYMQLLDVPVEIIQTGGDGSYLFADLPVGNYTLVAGLFGWLPVYRSIEVTQGDRLVIDIEMDRGCFDDFEIEQGWTVGEPGDEAHDGIWERDDPNATYFADQEVQPSDDHTADGVNCYITHNQPEGSPRFFGDVDGGRTTFLSPVFDATVAQSPVVTYWRWAHTVGGYPTDQEFRADISTDGGESWVNVDTFVGGDGGWEQVQVPLNTPGLLPTEQMRIRFVAEDIVHMAAVVEAAVDDVEVTGFPSSAEAREKPLVLKLSAPHPNPLGPGTILSFTLPRSTEVDLAVYDTAGRLVRRLVSGEQEAGAHRLFWDGRTESGRAIHSGVYFARLAVDGRELTRKMIVAR